MRSDGLLYADEQQVSESKGMNPCLAAEREVTVRYWVVLLSLCAAATIFGTLTVKRPMLTAIGVSVLAAIVTGLYGARNSPLWIVGSIIVIVCSLPVTIITGILTQNLLDKWRSRSNE